MCGADPDNSFPATLVHKVHPRVHGVEYVNAYYKTIREWFIPVHTGQMIPFYCFGLSAPVHPRAYGVDTKFLKRIPVVSKPVFFVLNFRNKTSMYHFR